MIGRARQPHFARAGPVQPHDDLGQRGLAAARGADQRQAFRAPDGKARLVHRAQRLVGPEPGAALGEVARNAVNLQQHLPDGGARQRQHVEARGGHQLLGIDLPRRRKGVGGRAGLDQPALVHHGNAAAQRAHRLEVVADEQERHAPPCADFGDQVEHLALGDEVERRGRLVCNEQVRAAGQRHGDHHPLPLSARKLMGEAVAMLELQPHLFEQLWHFEKRGVMRGVETDGFLDLLADPHQRVERRHRLLEHHADAFAAQPRHLALIGGQGGAIQRDRAAHACALGQEGRYGQRRQRLA